MAQFSVLFIIFSLEDSLATDVLNLTDLPALLRSGKVFLNKS